MGFPIDRELAGDVNNPSLELLDFILRKQAHSKKRFDKLDRYYNGKHDVLTRKLSNNSKDNKVVINHSKYVTDMAVGICYRKPIYPYSITRKEFKILLMRWTLYLTIPNWKKICL
ncbi:phage portal protein [Weissella koreensis]|uniref:phage portal protein n=1 Tax=Weissella koreensis TaxID=165096 RepID=UPI00021743E4|nr:phage portal protein [Weissella koreensis]AEJ23093.1 portal protein [Weissella koreensis KACC 15510]MCZ9310537.1 phage portal protein [Weissella koreensis]